MTWIALGLLITVLMIGLVRLLINKKLSDYDGFRGVVSWEDRNAIGRF